MLAHEIRTPLNGILAMSELIAAADLPRARTAMGGPGEGRGRASGRARDAGGRRRARRANAGSCCARSRFGLRALAEALGATLAARAEAKGLAADVSIADDLPELVIGDRVRLRAALENLIDNAVKFTERGRVALTVGATRAPRGRHRLTLTRHRQRHRATRPEIARLFRPFAQANVRVARRYGGSGLGLAFVRRLAKAMGGDLTVKSRPGHGSTFALHGDARASMPAAARPEAPRRNAVSATKSLRVLCAEDNPYARVVLNTILVELGHRVDFAGTGESAVAAVRSRRLRPRADGRDAAGHGRSCGHACDPRAERGGRGGAGYRHFRPDSNRRRGGRACRRHERVPGKAR